MRDPKPSDRILIRHRKGHTEMGGGGDVATNQGAPGMIRSREKLEVTGKDLA